MCQPFFIFDLMLRSTHVTIFLLAILVMSACEQKENAKPAVYEGPMTEGEDVQLLYVEKEALKLKVIAKRIQEFASGDREFPEGLYMEFYDETGKVGSTLKANHAFYFK